MVNFGTDYSVYITIINRLNNDFSLVNQINNYGIYNPTNVPPYIPSKSQIFFSLIGSIITGSEGLITYKVEGTGQLITFAFQCPQVSDNALSIPLNQTDFDVSYYGTNQPIQWNPSGINWGPANNFPKRGHPLYALFVVSHS